MRIYNNCKELMSEMGRELSSYGQIVKPKTYQNKVIEGNDEMVTKEIICQQYCLTDIKDVEALFVYTNTHEWADKEFEERVSGLTVNPGSAWELNKPMWEEFLVDTGFGGYFDYTYAERINDPVMYSGKMMTKLDSIIQLLKDDPDTRKAVLSIFGYCGACDDRDQDRLDGNARIPCSMYYDFLIRWNGKGEKQLNICYHQRSSDFVGHFGDDVYLAWKLMEYVADKVGINRGYLFHTIDSLHVYKRDWDKLKDNIENLF